MSEPKYIQDTKKWISNFVIALNLCPFAKLPFEQDLIRYCVSEEEDLISITNLVLEEIQFLNQIPSTKIETTLVILPQSVLTFEDFYEYNLVLFEIIEENNLEQLIQLVVFHPNFKYEGVNADEVSNYTNRSPYPMLHILRQQSIEQVADEFRGLNISERNATMLKELGHPKILDIIK